jgi:hypothetical protein
LGEGYDIQDYTFTKLFRLLLSLGGVMLPAGMWAQVTGTISGYVTDPSAAAISGVSVTAVMVEQTFTRTVKSNLGGFYDFFALPPGTYTVSAEKPGFQRLVRADISLTVSQNLRERKRPGGHHARHFGHHRNFAG